MIIFLTLCYVALLAVLVKLKVVRLTTFWKLSPLLWMVLLLIVLFIPMQWGAPLGSVTKYQYVVEIVPNVSGQVIEVLAEVGQRMNQGDVLFKIDPTTFEAAVGNLKAALELAETRLAQSMELVKRQAGSVYDVEQYEAQVKQYKEQLRSAEWNLAETVVRAPADGHVIGLTLQPGQRVSNLPLRAFQEVETSLANEKLLGEREGFLRAVVEENAQALRLSKAEYEVGKTDMLSVLLTQARWVAARVSLLRIQDERLLERVNLHLALGGSFEEG